MRYVGRKLAPPLDQFVDDVYVLSGVPRSGLRRRVPPMPSAHLMINLGDPAILHDSDRSEPPVALTGSWFMGLWTRHVTIEHGCRVHVAGVHFKPWGMAPFMPLPGGELCDRWVPAELIWGRSIDRLHDALSVATSPEAMLQLLEDELRARLSAPSQPGLALVNRTGGQLEQAWGTASVADLAERAGVSGNRLALAYSAQVGVGPKRLARIYRFAHLILSIDSTRPVDWAGLAHQVGYFDQPHLVNEFKGFTGLTPSDYLTLRQRTAATAGFPSGLGPMPLE